MLETNSWIYLDLEKTGCTFLRSKLIGLFPDSEFTNTEKHMIQNFKSSRIKILTIRDSFIFRNLFTGRKKIKKIVQTNTDNG